MAMTTEMILIRHGYTVRVNGDYLHAPLTPLGRQQAEQTGQHLFANHLPIDALYASPVRRAYETATIISSKIKKIPILRKGIREVEGFELPALALYEMASIFDPVEDYLDDRAGKSIRWPIQSRISKVLLNILETHPNQRVVIVVHTGVISSVLAWYFPEQRIKWWLHTVGNCSLTRLAVDDGSVKILGIDETKHLSPNIVTTQKPDRAVQVAEKIPLAVNRPQAVRNQPKS
jgi:broad specificity phosphatase PhoE